MKKAKILGIILILILSISMVVFASGKDTIDIDRDVKIASNNASKIEKEITNVKISLNGKPLDIPKEYGAPFIDNQSRTMIPLRIISERLGHKVDWDQATRTASIDNQVFITIGKNVVKTPKGDVVMDTKAVLKDTRTYVPLRFVVEALNYEVKYDGPKASNGYNHMVDIFKEGITLPTEPTGPVKEGNIYKIQTETGVVEVNLDTDLKEEFGVKMGLTDNKAIELLESWYKSIKLNETKDNINIVMFRPELPNGMEYSGNITLVTKDGRYLSIYSADTKESRLWTVRNDGYIEINYNEDLPSEIEHIEFIANVVYNGRTSIPYKAELRSGKTAIGRDKYLYD